MFVNEKAIPYVSAWPYRARTKGGRRACVTGIAQSSQSISADLTPMVLLTITAIRQVFQLGSKDRREELLGELLGTMRTRTGNCRGKKGRASGGPMVPFRQRWAAPRFLVHPKWETARES